MILERVKEILKTPLIGFTGTRALEEHYLEVSTGIYSHAISFGVPLLRGVLETVTDRPSLLYKHHYQTINSTIDSRSTEAASFLELEGYRALPIPASRIVDWERQRGHLPHKLAAFHAGLGWHGLSGLLINPDFGAMVRYGTILTDLPLPPVERLPGGDCQDCTLCLEACPAGAIQRRGQPDLDRCLARLREFSRIKGIGQYICGVCIKVCPVGRR